MTEALIAAFILILLSEIADKTQLVVFGLALKYKSPLKVFAGALTAHVVMDSIAIFIGAFLGIILTGIIATLIAMAFIGLGFFEIWKLYFRKSVKKESKKKPSGSPFIMSFLLIAGSEFGDKTQIVSGLLSSRYLLPFDVLAGTVLALIVTIGLTVLITRYIGDRLPRKAIKTFTAFVFILTGLLMFLT